MVSLVSGTQYSPLGVDHSLKWPSVFTTCDRSRICLASLVPLDFHVAIPDALPDTAIRAIRHLDAEGSTINPGYQSSAASPAITNPPIPIAEDNKIRKPRLSGFRSRRHHPSILSIVRLPCRSFSR